MGSDLLQEIDPNPENQMAAENDEGSFLGDLASSIPGIDEAMSFAEVMRQVELPGPICMPRSLFIP